MKKYKSYNIQIWCGLREGYTNITHSIEEVHFICDHFIDTMNGECVSITPTHFRYSNGFEDGVVIGFIQYPRFPVMKKEKLRKAIQLAESVRILLGQIRVTVTTPKKTYLIEEEEN